MCQPGGGGTSERRKGEGRGIEGNTGRETERHSLTSVYKDTHSKSKI